MESAAPTIRNRRWLRVVLLVASLLLIAWAVWGLLTGFPDFSEMQVASGSIELPVPAPTATIP